MKLFVKRNIINKLRQRNKFRREYIKQVKYWREHPDEFIEDFYEIKIYWYQKFFLRKFFKRGKRALIKPIDDACNIKNTI